MLAISWRLNLQNQPLIVPDDRNRHGMDESKLLFSGITNIDPFCRLSLQSDRKETHPKWWQMKPRPSPMPRARSALGASETVTGRWVLIPFTVRPGQGAVIDSYQLFDLIGEGGMGEVWLANRRSRFAAAWRSS